MSIKQELQKIVEKQKQARKTVRDNVAKIAKEAEQSRQEQTGQSSRPD
ncbi:unnamed protein product [marine sediment metagenome]|uniref:Uncharacterized protein n=1 Tax=marine sediment metagenome TaxID=412755 RepID=X1R9X2_9ZZZZ